MKKWFCTYESSYSIDHEAWFCLADAAFSSVCEGETLIIHNRSGRQLAEFWF